MGKSRNYSTAYAEVLEVLNHIPLEDYEKIPKNYITFLEENKDENCSFKYNVALPFEKQGLSENAKDILGTVFRLFIISEEKKKELAKKDKLEQLEKQAKYNPDNIFKTNNIEINNTDSKNTDKKAMQEKNALLEKNDSIFKRIMNRIKTFLNIH